jgi:hypothetical protein
MYSEVVGFDKETPFVGMTIDSPPGAPVIAPPAKATGTFDAAGGGRVVDGIVSPCAMH